MVPEVWRDFVWVAYLKREAHSSGNGLGNEGELGAGSQATGIQASRISCIQKLVGHANLLSSIQLCDHM